MKILGSTKTEVDEDKDQIDAQKLESMEVGLVHSILISNNYQKASKVLFTFAPNKQLGQLINVLSFINNAKHNK